MSRPGSVGITGASGRSKMQSRLVAAMAAAFALVSVLGCHSETSERGDSAKSATPANPTKYDGTVGDAVIEFVDTIDALADILAEIDDLDDCHKAQESIAYQVNRLRQLHAVVGVMSVKAWAQMPRSLDEKRRAAVRHFNAEAVRVLMDRERGNALRDVIADVPSLIYPELQS